MKHIAPPPPHYSRVLAGQGCRTAILIVLLMTFLLSKTIYSQPVITPTITDATCGQSDGSLSVNITGCYPPDIYVQQFQGTSPGNLAINIPPYYPSQLPVVFPYLPIGSYSCIIMICGATWEYDFVIEDNSYWPIIPVNDERVFCIDLKNDAQHNVVAAGNWEGNVDLFPPDGTTGTMTSINPFNIFLAKYNSCGQLLWQQQINSGTVNAIDVTPDQEIVMVGNFQTQINFPPSTTLTCSSGWASFVAKFRLTDGACLWAAKIENMQYYGKAKDVTADGDGNIFVLGDFTQNGIYLYNASGGSTYLPKTYAGTSSDIFLAAYSSNGNLITALDHPLTSGPQDDYAGGLCCTRNNDGFNNVTEIIITGTKGNTTPPANTEFLGQRYFFSNNILDYKTDFDIAAPAGSNPLDDQTRTGMCVDYCIKGNNNMFVFSGYTIDPSPTGTIRYRPFICSVNSSLPFPTPPFIQNITDYRDFFDNVNTGLPYGENYASNVAINKLSGDIKIGGIINYAGFHPYNSGLTVPGNGNNGSIFIDHFPSASSLTQIGQIKSYIYTYQGNIIYNSSPNPEGYMSLCSDNTYQSFAGGSYTAGLNTIPLGMNIPSNSNTGCFIARIIDMPNGIIKIKNLPVIPESFTGMEGLNISTYPNPASSEINILLQCSDHGIDQVDLLSLPGQHICTFHPKEAGKGRYTINPEKITSGMYLLRIRSGQQIVLKKIVVQ